MTLAFLVLTAAPGSRHLADATLAVCRDALPPGAIADERTLSPGEAWEARLDMNGASLAALQEAAARAIGATAVDVNIVPAAARAKRLLCADMESTIIEQEMLDEMADLAGRREDVARITAATMRGELDFAASLAQRVALFAGFEADRLVALLDRVTLMPGAETLVRTMRANGATAALVTGGFTIFAEPIARRLGFDAVFANVLDIENGRLTGRVREPILGPEGKADAMKRLAHAGGLDLNETLAVGDGANDVAMLAAAGLGVAFRAKPMVARAARASERGAVITHGDLTALLYLQGFECQTFAD
jgi:phosphoserine phosphatase